MCSEILTFSQISSIIYIESRKKTKAVLGGGDFHFLSATARVANETPLSTLHYLRVASLYKAWSELVVIYMVRGTAYKRYWINDNGGCNRA